MNSQQNVLKAQVVGWLAANGHTVAIDASEQDVASAFIKAASLTPSRGRAVSTRVHLANSLPASPGVALANELKTLMRDGLTKSAALDRIIKEKPDLPGIS